MEEDDELSEGSRIPLVGAGLRRASPSTAAKAELRRQRRNVSEGTSEPVIVYDNQTRSMVQTDGLASVSSRTNTVQNEYRQLGRRPLRAQTTGGMEHNWVQTIPGRAGS